MNANERTKARRILNVGLAKLSTHSAATYYDHVPAQRIADLVEECGFDGAEMNGIYCGEKGRVNVAIGFNTFLCLTWERIRTQYEVIAYAS